jgi:glycosyltransferase involved in cell wall biosynthesis
VGGFQEVIEDGKNGFLFEVNHHREAMTKIEALIDDASKRARLIKNGCLTVEETYSSERIVDKYLEILRGLAGSFLFNNKKPPIFGVKNIH